MQAPHDDPMAALVPDDGLEKNSRVWCIEKPATEEPSGHRFLTRVVRHFRWAYGRGLQPVQITGGYCWSFHFKVLGVLFLGEVSSAFLPSKKAWHWFSWMGICFSFPMNRLCHLHVENFARRQPPFDHSQSDSGDFSGRKMDAKEIVDHPIDM